LAHGHAALEAVVLEDELGGVLELAVVLEEALQLVLGRAELWRV